MVEFNGHFLHFTANQSGQSPFSFYFFLFFSTPVPTQHWFFTLQAALLMYLIYILEYIALVHVLTWFCINWAKISLCILLFSLNTVLIHVVVFTPGPLLLALHRIPHHASTFHVSIPWGSEGLRFPNNTKNAVLNLPLHGFLCSWARNDLDSILRGGTAHRHTHT